MQTVLWVTILGLVLHGLGIAAQLVSSFSDALRTCVAHGFPNNLETFGMVSGLWTSTFALGAFIGPSIAGILFDAVGFRYATLFIFLLHLLLGLAVFIFICCSKEQAAYTEIKEEPVDDVASYQGKSAQAMSVTESMKSIRSVGNGISIERSRPAGMNSLIACNSYKTQAWPQRDVSSLTLSQYGCSYGTLQETNCNADTSSYIQGVA
ncbi:unnamed protein product [Acanthoscelides obtectus]|uniref:Major facilitator superfamily (MFS) profile domain-containing protein n=1 Tax=Acanthoscelides obtectus TaxID=200917 RepID=A0A9P0P0C5_ACAOB|nr:unnamed protein product [Acanthoscelides obtectus]CAK1648941.1 MFS-type transporter SLC18B1 [Acanthoscelides obtectus]